MFRFVNMENVALYNIFSEAYYSQIKNEKVSGRYIANLHLEDFEIELSDDFKIDVIGKSVQEKAVKLITFGKGDIKILAWSQMHGNEGTTTKAVFDLLNAFNKNDKDRVLLDILDRCTLFIIPVLNPDGAEAYTRVNANKVDLNRDMQDLSQPESKILMEQYYAVKPDFCLNLHDQRTIFSAGNTNAPATLSFLTPSKDKERSIDMFRKQSMSVISGIAKDLSGDLPGGIGRYDDAYNINCAGDTFQNLSTPTILFEAGHFPGDYEREETRKYVFKALFSAIYQISIHPERTDGYLDYFNIPENEKLYYDVIIRNSLINGEIRDICIQFQEILSNEKIRFSPVIAEIEERVAKYAHREIDAQGNEVSMPGNTKLDENVIVDKIIINSTELEVKYV